MPRVQMSYAEQNGGSAAAQHALQMVSSALWRFFRRLLSVHIVRRFTLRSLHLYKCWITIC